MSFGLTPQRSDLSLVNLRSSSTVTTSRSVCDVLDAGTVVAGSINGVTEVMPDVILAEGDLVVGSAAGQPSRLPVGPADTVLVGNGVTVVWGAVPTPITTEGDLIVGNVTGEPVRLALGANGNVLQSNGTTAVWDTVPTPITTQGDLIVGNVSGAAVRLALGADGTVLTSNGTAASWVAPAAKTGLVVQFTNIVRQSFQTRLGSSSYTGEGGNYTVTTLIANPDYVVPVAGDPWSFWRVLQAGNYVVEFSAAVTLNNVNNLEVIFVTSTGADNPFLVGVPTSIGMLGAAVTALYTGPLAARYFFTFAANANIGVRIDGDVGTDVWPTGAWFNVTPLF